MKTVFWFRTAAVLMLLFAAGHTYGFLAFRPTSAEGLEVWSGMNRVRFAVGQGSFSYGEFYRGFGVSITVSLLFSAWLLWVLGSLARKGGPGVQTIAWGVLIWQLTGIYLSLSYFSAAPAIFSALVAICIGLGISALRKAQR